MKLEGKDNYGNPRQDYVDKITAMNEADFERECGNAIWFSAYAANNGRSDYHWQADACYTVCRERFETDEIYTRAWHTASQS
jgi:transposase